jgi:nucleoside-diphosphate-sugar epimerase
MRFFITGASGFIGSAVVQELLRAGYQVTGLARSDASAAAVAAAGADVLRGDIEDLELLRAGAAASDGVAHLAYIHDFSQMEAAARADQRAIETIATALEGSNRPLAIASGVLLLAPGRVSTEADMPRVQGHVHPRVAGAQTAVAFASRGVRTSIVRLAPTVHGEGDHGFVPRLIAVAREKGVSGYIGDGSNRWPAVHRFDAANLFRLALESAPAGAMLHGVDEQGVPARQIAEVIGRHLNLPVRSVPPEDAAEHFGWIGGFFALDAPSSNTMTRELLGWRPTHGGLIEDLEQGHYFALPADNERARATR